MTTRDEEILGLPAQELAHRLCAGVSTSVQGLKAREVLLAFGKRTITAHERLNCLTEVFIDTAYKEADRLDNTQEPVGPLHGVPISVKDTVNFAGIDATLGYSKWIHQPAAKDSVIVRLLKQQGAVFYTKTNIPQTLLSFESSNPVFGTTRNHHNQRYSAGGSSGGEGALLSAGGSLLGLGTDIAGSVRIPAHYSGICALKPSHGRISKSGNVSSNSGIESIPGVIGPMTQTVDDLEFFTKILLKLEMWKYDQGVIPIPYREPARQDRMRFGYYTYDGLIHCSPACVRAVEMTVEALRKAGHDVVEFQVPDILHAYITGTKLIVGDSGQTVYENVSKDKKDEGVDAFLKLHRIPMFLKKLYAWYLETFYNDYATAALLLAQHKQSVYNLWKATAARDRYRQQFLTTWDSYASAATGQEMDGIICPVNPLPAIPHGGLAKTYTGLIYTFLYNILDYSVGVLPVTKVDRHLDDIPNRKTLEKTQWNRMEKNLFSVYNVDDMHGLPIGVQVVGRRLQEEKVIAMMQVVKDALNAMDLPELNGQTKVSAESTSGNDGASAAAFPNAMTPRRGSGQGRGRVSKLKREKFSRVESVCLERIFNSIKDVSVDGEEFISDEDFSAYLRLPPSMLPFSKLIFRAFSFLGQYPRFDIEAAPLTFHRFSMAVYVMCGKENSLTEEEYARLVFGAMGFARWTPKRFNKHIRDEEAVETQPPEGSTANETVAPERQPSRGLSLADLGIDFSADDNVFGESQDGENSDTQTQPQMSRKNFAILLAAILYLLAPQETVDGTDYPGSCVQTGEAVADRLQAFSNPTTTSLQSMSTDPISFSAFATWQHAYAPNLFILLQTFVKTAFLMASIHPDQEQPIHRPTWPSVLPDLEAPVPVARIDIAKICLALPAERALIGNEWPLLYSASRDGFSMNRFEHGCFKYNAPTFLLVSAETKDGSPLIIGIYMSVPWKHDVKPFGDQNIRVLQLDPWQVYVGTRQNDQYVCCEREGGIGIGGIKYHKRARETLRRKGSLGPGLESLPPTVTARAVSQSLTLEDEYLLWLPRSLQEGKFSRGWYDIGDRPSCHDPLSSATPRPVKFNINDIHLYGLGTPDTLAHQKAAWEYEKKEANRRLEGKSHDTRQFLKLAGIIE
ncbi:hypothetical protein BZG36_00540 [Bifiguratus adelaidae]|uniref:amidase n=1 Tax=Bifiguratus adelaidae TaxID=1938954 RepID=A0A261Y7F5_9FUNG|nr:hypothetical protein BZG36_00540 [Bifiguratus adelaidae]